MHLLVVTYPFPPMPSTGSNRWTAMTRYLRELGHEVTVLTTAAFGARESDAENDVVRVHDVVANDRLRRLLRRPPLPEPGQAAAPDVTPPKLLTDVVVPDIYAVTWAPAAALAARRLHRERRFNAVVTTSPYESTHLVALGLGPSGPAWVADFRDSWAWQPWRPPFPTRPQRTLDRHLEALVVKNANRITTVHETLAEDFARRYDTPVDHVPNGWDPTITDGGETGGSELDPRKLSLVHTGKLVGVWGRHPAGLFAGMRRLRERDPDAGGKLELVLAGRLDDDEQRALDASGVNGMVRHLGHLTREQSTALQRRADALLLLTSTRLSWEAPGKLFEYLLADRPIVALAAGSEAGRIVAATGTGAVVPPDDADAIADVLGRLVDGHLKAEYAPRGLDRFVYP